MVDDKLKPETIQQIQKLSVDLTSTEKASLYALHKSSAGGSFVLNFLFGCGLGSFVQGDIGHGGIFLVGDLLGASLLASGIITVNEGNYSTRYVERYDANGHYVGSYYQQVESSGEGSIIAGAIILGICRIWECTQTFRYSKLYNQRLNNALNSTASANVAILPTIVDNSIGATVAAEINF